MKFDIVIATSNNISSKQFSLYFTIRSILSQTIQPQKIIVSENKEYLLTKEKLIAEFGSLVTVIDSTEKPNNISFARNNGAKMGDGEFILFMDDDVVIGKNETLFDVSQKMKHLDFYCGASRYWTNTNWHNFIQKSESIYHIQRILKAKSYLPKSIDRFSGKQSFHEFSYVGNFGAVRRNVFLQLNGFDELYTGWTYQDTDLMMRLALHTQNYQVMQFDNIHIYHLAHSVDKSEYLEKNRERFIQKQKELKIKFYINHFFGVFDDELYSIYCPEEPSQNLI